MKLCEWPLEDVGKVFKMTRVCCGAQRVKANSKSLFIVYFAGFFFRVFPEFLGLFIMTNRFICISA